MTVPYSTLLYTAVVYTAVARASLAVLVFFKPRLCRCLHPNLRSTQNISKEIAVNQIRNVKNKIWDEPEQSCPSLNYLTNSFKLAEKYMLME